MDIITILIIVLVIAIIAGVGFVLARRNQRSGTVLAAPKSDHSDGGSS